MVNLIRGLRDSMRFDVEITKLPRLVITRDNKEPNGFRKETKDIDYMVITTHGEPGMSEIKGIIDELYTDIVDLCFKYDAIGIIINPKTTNIETIVTDETILDNIADILNNLMSENLDKEEK